MILSEFQNSIYLCRTMLNLIEMETEQFSDNKSLIWCLALSRYYIQVDMFTLHSTFARLNILIAFRSDQVCCALYWLCDND